MITDRSQRWRERRSMFVPATGTINPAEFSVDIVDCMKTAKPFVVANHYSGSFPASRWSVGLFRSGRTGTSRLVGLRSAQHTSQIQALMRLADADFCLIKENRVTI